jgi:aquaporin related protein
MDGPTLARVPTMYINRSDTALGRVDPLKGALRSLFNGLPKPTRGHVVAVLGEFIGTLSFIFFAFAGVQVGAASSNKNQGVGVSTADASKSPQALLYASLAAGFSLVVHAWTFFRISGGLFNPVVCRSCCLSPIFLHMLKIYEFERLTNIRYLWEWL